MAQQAHERAGEPVSRRLVVAWIIVALVALPLALQLRTRAAPPGSVRGTESARFEELLHTRFATPWEQVAVLVVSGMPERADTDEGRARLRRLLSPIEALRGVGNIIAPSSSLDTMLVGADGHTAIALVALRNGHAGLLDSLRALTKLAREAEVTNAPSLRMQWTGQDAFVEDLRQLGATESRRAELRALPLTALVTVWSFGSVSAALAAGGIALLAIVAALGITAMLSAVVPVTSFVTIVATVIGVALSLDYVLYLTWRRRTGIVRDVSGRRTVWLAALLVALAFAGLLIAPTGEFRGAAVGGAVVAIAAALASTTLSPFVRAPRFANSEHDRWLRWGRGIARHPLLALIAGFTPLVLLASKALDAKLETPLDKWLPGNIESVAAIAQLERAGRGSIVGAARVVLELPEGTPVLTPAGWNALGSATDAMKALPGVASVRSIASIGTGDLVVAQHVFPAAVKHAQLSSDGRAALIEVLPDLDHGRNVAASLAQALRALDAAQVTGLAGSHITVGGIPAFALDYATGTRQALPWIIAIIATVTWLVLAIALRAPLVATKAVLLNLLVATASIGTTVLVFQDGWAPRWLGPPLGSILPTVPLIAFGAAFGVSIDYELFLVAAVRERWRAGDDAAESAAQSVAAVGGLITRAAAVMLCLFFALTASALKTLAMVGFTLGVAVLFDATLVRLVLAPALMRIAGEWNWWPGNTRRAGDPQQRN